LDIIRGMANIHERAEVMGESNFPSGAGKDLGGAHAISLGRVVQSAHF
jgi:hypothetical protein